MDVQTSYVNALAAERRSFDTVFRDARKTLAEDGEPRDDESPRTAKPL